MGIPYWIRIHEFKSRERPVYFSVCLSVWLTTSKVWRWLYAVDVVALLWCNFSSCSRQLFVERNWKPAGLGITVVKINGVLWNWDSVMATWDYPNWFSDVFHLTLFQLHLLSTLLHWKNSTFFKGRIVGLDRTDFGLLDDVSVFQFFCDLQIIKVNVDVLLKLVLFLSQISKEQRKYIVLSSQ